jgi:murein DD-endopeptidase MepM/ murein hydrolase activator NlpD
VRGLGRLIAVALCLALVAPSAASAETAAQLKSRLEELKRRSASAGRAYESAFWKLDETEVALGETRVRLKNAEKRLIAAKRKLNMRANGMYRRDNLDFLTFLVGASNFEQLVTRADYVVRIGAADASVVADVKRLRRALIAEKKRLAAEQRKRAANVRSLRAERDRLQSRLRTVEAEFREVKRRRDAVRSGGTIPTGISSAPGPHGMVFPVLGSYYYADTWGASRSGGRRRHQGTDIMSPHGTPCVAVLSGTVTAKEGGLGGKTIWLRADNGWSFYYAHLQGWAVRSGRVRAGQVIGYVGSTGNATASAPHLHFQIHPNGGAPVNPYPYLRSME